MYTVLAKDLAHQSTPNAFAGALPASKHQRGFRALVWMLKCPCGPINNIACYCLVAIGEHFANVVTQSLPVTGTRRYAKTLPQVQQASIDHARRPRREHQAFILSALWVLQPPFPQAGELVVGDRHDYIVVKQLEICCTVKCYYRAAYFPLKG